MSALECWKWDATTLARAIRERQISCREALESCLSRLEQVNPAINAVVEVLSGEARRGATRADEALESRAPVGPLHGVPVTTKINVDQVGVATSNGVLAFKNLIAQEDSPPVRNWREAGAVFMGRTNAPAYSLRWATDNALYGLTRHPRGVGWGVLGSSGGAAAAVATGIGPLAHANDLAGSVRLPASACGVYGLRPTTGRVPAFNPTAPRERSILLQLGSTQGVIARSVDDLRLGLMTLAARDHRDPWWAPAPIDMPTNAQPARVAVFAGDAEFQADPNVANELRRAAAVLADAGYAVEFAAPPRFGEAARTWMALLANDARDAAAHAALNDGDEGFQRAYALTRRCSPVLSGDDMLAALALRTTILREWLTFFATHSLLLLPTSWSLPFPVGHDLRGESESRQMLTAHSPCTATAFLGLPAVSIPMRRGRQIPIGVQLVSARFQDELCLEAAATVEQALGPVTPINPLSE